ncbi:hypothetical protein [Latilactobacillus curvatus]|uniref:hypothetical protein n=1 Tax=Latilactobacillus curvatus TaxID=28038 RepID=UPI0039B0DBEE
MFDLFKHNKEPLHVTRQTVFDNESIPAAALDGDLERRVAALEILGRAIEPRVNDLVDIHKKEITVHHANEVARKAYMDAESAARISSGTINAKEWNAVNVANHGYSSDEVGVHIIQVGDTFAKSQIEPDTKTEKEAKLLADIMFIKGEIEKVANVSRAVKFEEKHLNSDLGYLTKFLQTLGVNCYESETTTYRQGKPYKRIKGLVVGFGND